LRRPHGIPSIAGAGANPPARIIRDTVIRRIAISLYFWFPELLREAQPHCLTLPLGLPKTVRNSGNRAGNDFAVVPRMRFCVLSSNLL
jgi:hypothetical protein